MSFIWEHLFNDGIYICILLCILSHCILLYWNCTVVLERQSLNLVTIVETDRRTDGAVVPYRACGSNMTEIVVCCCFAVAVSVMEITCGKCYFINVMMQLKQQLILCKNDHATHTYYIIIG